MSRAKISKPSKGLVRKQVSEAGMTETNQAQSPMQFPGAMYLHTPIKSKENPDGCPTEWWWHTGTLVAADGREFGFEINAAAFYPFYVTEVMLTDKVSQKHYQQTYKLPFPIGSWAESDQNKDWKVDLMNVQMEAPQADPTKNMKVKASLYDAGQDATVSFDLTLSQEGKPFLVWGNGITSPPSPPKLDTNNFYFSLTRLKVTGTITISVEEVLEPPIAVTGTTWMDHEWGMFENHGKAVKWILQDMQLNNGFTISNFSLQNPVLKEEINGLATVQQGPNDGTATHNTKIKPTKSWKSPEGREYFTEVVVQIPDFDAELTVSTMMDDQLFTGFSSVSPIYEGAGSVSGKMTVEGKSVEVQGTAWLEQTEPPKQS